MKYKYILFFIILMSACKQKREVSTSFYYWKTVYKQDTLENSYLKHFKSKRLYVRIMDVDAGQSYEQNPIPVAPVSFASPLPDSLEIVPVVFIVNDLLKPEKRPEIKELAKNISNFVNAKVGQAGKMGYQELQLDCDWTETTRNNYFLLLSELQQLNKGKVLSATLRLHQLKNQTKSGIPPVNRVLLMCYNMGNLRQYGTQNSILNIAELKKYAGKNLEFYPKGIDVALPLFSWAVVFRNSTYNGISKRVKPEDLKDALKFNRQKNGLYRVKMDLPDFGLQKDDQVRYEESNLNDVEKAASYLSSYLSGKPINVLYYHLDHNILKNIDIHELEKISNLLR